MRLLDRSPITLLITIFIIASIPLAIIVLKPHQQLTKLSQLIKFGSHVSQPIWLVATISAASSQRRRNIIRATMHKAYASPLITFGFVISNPTETWMPVIQHENDTYGDIIMLSHLEESAHIANTIKTVEFLHFATMKKARPASLQSWEYVSKVDDDSFVALPAFYETYLAPLLDWEGTEGDVVEPHVLIGRKLGGSRPYSYPGGQFYTLSRKTATTIAEEYSRRHITDAHEDVLIGRLLYEAGEEFEVTELPNQVAFDWDASVGDERAWSHGITGPEALNPHKMKDDEVFLEVAAKVLALHPPKDIAKSVAWVDQPE